MIADARQEYELWISTLKQMLETAKSHVSFGGPTSFEEYSMAVGYNRLLDEIISAMETRYKNLEETEDDSGSA